jgi:hypothetical protein
VAWAVVGAGLQPLMVSYAGDLGLRPRL